MLLNYIKQKQKRLMESQVDFYTPSGVHVYYKDSFHNGEIDLEEIIETVDTRIPEHLRSEMEMVIVGWFDEFEERDLTAFYNDGILHISNAHLDDESVYTDIVHELAHSIETPYGHTIYGDNKVKTEFLEKRQLMHDLLWQRGYKAPLAFFMDPEYNEEFDKFLFEKVGYDKLSQLLQGIFISPYAPTSLREYFATGFAEYYLDSNHNFLQQVSPQLYKKLFTIQDIEKLDTY